jgi:hypothetical protein
MDWKNIKGKNESIDNSLYVCFRRKDTGEVIGIISEDRRGGWYRFSVMDLISFSGNMKRYDTYSEALDDLKKRVKRYKLEF